MSSRTIYRAIWTDIEDSMSAVFPSTSWRGTLPEGLQQSTFATTWFGMGLLIERELQGRSGDLLLWKEGLYTRLVRQEMRRHEERP